MLPSRKQYKHAATEKNKELGSDSLISTDQSAILPSIGQLWPRFNWFLTFLRIAHRRLRRTKKGDRVERGWRRVKPVQQPCVHSRRKSRRASAVTAICSCTVSSTLAKVNAFVPIASRCVDILASCSNENYRGTFARGKPVYLRMCTRYADLSLFISLTFLSPLSLSAPSDIFTFKTVCIPFRRHSSRLLLGADLFSSRQDLNKPSRELKVCV